ncbi:MAG TPA: beta/gamma crystallin-related protein [Candidatus Dormibacteraeota bacterium]|jgi:hypothetical protein
MPAHIILFKDANFHGPHKHVFEKEPNLDLVLLNPDGSVERPIDTEFFRTVSSLAILGGNWKFYSELEFGGEEFPTVLGPGLYRFVGDYKIANDAIASLQSVPDDPTMPGEPLNGHAILFRHAGFHGEHRHVFVPEPDLATNGFDNVTSSIVVESGNWSFFFDTEMDGHYDPVLGPGIYPWVEDVGIGNDGVTSLQPTSAAATVSNSVDNEVILFEHCAFHGAHRHVFADEPNLNAGDDDTFNDLVSALVVLKGGWSFYRDANFIGPYPIPPLLPGLYSVAVDHGIANDDLSSLRPAIPTRVVSGDGVAGEVILFEHANFRGRHRHVLNAEDNLNADDDDGFNDSVSSIVVVSGSWQFFRNSGFDDDYPSILGPGVYPWVEDVDIRNDDLSSLRVVDQEPNVTGDPLAAHVVLFEHRGFHGAHKHVVRAEPNLNADEDDEFNDLVSSMVVLAGDWAAFADSDFRRQYPTVLGAGCYPWVVDVEIPNDDLSSLEPTDASPTVSAPIPFSAQAVLFEHARFHGDHKHVFTDEPSLFVVETGPDGRVRVIDTEFNDSVSSIAVLLDQWRAFRDVQFGGAYDVILGGGLYPGVTEVGIANDDMSSLRVARPVVQFSGQVSLRIDSSFTPDPLTAVCFFQFEFTPATRAVEITAFSDLNLGQGVVATFKGAGEGSFPADGQVTIPDLVFAIDLPFPATDTTATFSLSTGTVTSFPKAKFTVTGSPADAAGNVVLVGAGGLQGGSPDTDDFAVSLAGVIQPRPA